MQKYVQNIWMRIVSCLLCTIAVIGIGISALCSVFYAEAGSYEQIYQEGMEGMANAYSLYAYNLIEQNNQTGLTSFLKEHGLYCSIYKVEKITEENGEIKDNAVLAYTNTTEDTEYAYTLEIIEGSNYEYNFRSVWSAFLNSYWFEPEDHWVEFDITGYAYDAADGIFYYVTEIGNFPIKNIEIYLEDNSYIDYKLKMIEGKYCYYNGFYNTILDPAEAENWKYMSTNHHRMKLWDYENSGEWGEVAYIQDMSMVPEDFQNAEYEVMGYDATIGCYYAMELDKYQIQIDWDRNIEKENLFREWEETVNLLYCPEGITAEVLIICLLLLGIGMVLLITSCTSEKEKLGWMYKVPVCIYAATLIALEALGVVFIKDGILDIILYTYVQTEVGYVLLAMTIFFMVLLIFAFLQNILTRIRTGVFWRYSEFYYLVKALKWCCRNVLYVCTRPFAYMGRLMKENVSLFWKGLGILLIISFADLVMTMLNIYDQEGQLLWFLTVKIIEIPLILFVLLQMKTLQEGAKRIASGDLSKPIDTKRMLWEFKKHGDYINNVSESIHLAVDERMKSERFKTELITNVSHDIKTPLTSIINYVDLIKKEEITDKKLCEYVEVLDRQSARLKKLIEDLMEASKASTGNLNVNLEECDVEVLLTQIIGEFEEKLIANELQVVVDKPEHPVLVMADGRHMWRVLDNLLGNACKYALPHTRVYISLVQEGELATIVFKNISKAALNIPSEELMERFVRGDSSRNTEGSGLGLSIAQSLTELMNGTMRLDIDGDLFKVTLSFHALKK